MLRCAPTPGGIRRPHAARRSAAERVRMRYSGRRAQHRDVKKVDITRRMVRLAPERPLRRVTPDGSTCNDTRAAQGCKEDAVPGDNAAVMQDPVGEGFVHVEVPP